MSRLLREPLLHFVLLGALIFVVAAAERGRDADPGRIVVTTGQIAHLADGFARTWQRPPTAAELEGLVAEWIRDEVYYREAMAAGLDRDDTVVRRRLRQKMEFLVEDALGAPAPSDGTLQAFLDAHPETFRVADVVAFRQVYVSRDRRGDRAESDAAALLDRLVAAGPDAPTEGLGDPLMVPGELTDASADEVARVFGDAFARALAGVPVGAWSGPVESGYGLHLVLVRTRSPARTPALAEVRAAVARAHAAAERRRMVDAAYAALRDRYEIVVEPRPAEDAVAAR